MDGQGLTWKKRAKQENGIRFSLWKTVCGRIAAVILCGFVLTGMAGCNVQTNQAEEETVAPSAAEETQNTVSENTQDTPVIPEVTEADTLPDYWLEPLNAGAKSIREAVQRAGFNRSSFLFYTDTHWNNSERVSPKLLTYLYQHTPLNKVIFGGDIVNSEPDPQEMEESDVMEYLWQWRSEIRDLKHYSVVGNHDDGEDTNNLFSYEYVYTYLFAPEDSPEITRGGYTYYFFDDVSERTRYLCLDTAYEGIYNISSEQIAFLTESLKSTPEGWHIIVVAHAWFAPDYENYVPTEPIPVLPLTPHAAAVAEILDQYNARSGVFRKCGAKVEFCIGGHVHRDYVGETPEGIPIILCETDSRHVRSGLEHTQGTATEAAVSGIVADYENGKLSVIRIGRGSSFEVELASDQEPENEDSGAYANLLETAGYADGYRLSAANGMPVINANTDLSGFIPVKKGDVVRLKNVEMPDTTDSYYAVVGYYLPDQTYLNVDDMHSALREAVPVYDKYGNLVQFTVTNEQAAFLRICARKMDSHSVITVNEPIE